MSKRKQLNLKNNGLDQKLTQENKAIVIDMVAYLRVAPISDIQIEEIRQDILDMALSAQERQDPLTEVFGEDGKAFCDEIILNIEHRKPGNLILQWLTVLCGVVSIFGMIDLIFSGYLIAVFRSLYRHAKISLLYPITFGFIINSFMIVGLSFGIVFLICRNTWKAKEVAKKFDMLPKPRKFLIGCLTGAMIFGYLFVIVQLGKITLAYVNIIFYCILLLTLFIAYKISSKI